MIVGTVKETAPGETRVAITPGSARKLIRNDHRVVVESDAGRRAGFRDRDYEEEDVEVVDSREAVFEQADVVAVVNGLANHPEGWSDDLEHTRAEQTIVGLMNPYETDDLLEQAAGRDLSVLAMELIPRISRAQSMDALSSQANIGGYKATVLAAQKLPKMFPMMMTAAGTVKPAKVFVIGAGVAGLQSIATAKRLGAQVEGYDIRLEVKEQVESLGADFVELDLETEGAEGEGGYAREMDEEFYAKQRERLTEVLEYSDVVITTANIPGKPAPELVSEEMIEQMPPGAVIVDLAAVNGGNCELTEAGEEKAVHGVTILGPTDLPRTVPYHASQLYSNNVASLINEFSSDGELNLDLEDEIIDSILLTHEGQVRNPHRSTDEE